MSRVRVFMGCISSSAVSLLLHCLVLVIDWCIPPMMVYGQCKLYICDGLENLNNWS